MDLRSIGIERDTSNVRGSIGGAPSGIGGATGITPSTEAYALLFARKIRGKLATAWSVGETGTAGPTGSRYGHAAGHSCIAVIGPNVERSITVETGNSDRLDNMRAFSVAALDLLERELG